MGVEKLELSDIVGGQKTIQLPGNSSGRPDNMGAFPVGALGVSTGAFAMELQKAYGIDAGYIITSAIVAISTAIGRKFETVVKGSYTAPPIVNAALVGPSGDGKTHGLYYSFKPLFDHDSRMFSEYQQALKEHERAEREATKENPYTGERPQYTDRFIFENTTIESLYSNVANIKNGVCVFSDELLTWVYSWNKYNNGNERGNMIKKFEGKTISIDTKKDGPKRIENSHISEIGGIQNARLPEFIGDISDGYTERICYVFGTMPYKALNDYEADEAAMNDYYNNINKLIQIDFNYNSFGQIEPVEVRFSADAFKVYKDWQKDIERRVNEGGACDGLSRTIYTKMAAYPARLALIVQAMLYVSGEQPNISAISEQAARNAVELAEYYISSSFRAHGEAKEQDPTKKLTTQQLKIYEALPGEFKTSTGIEIAARFGMNERGAKRFFNRKELFVRAKHGEYEKLY